MRESRTSGRAAVLHTLGHERRAALRSRHPDLERLDYAERHALYLRSYPDPFDTLAPALRVEGIAVDVVLDDPAAEDTEAVRGWLRRFGPELVLASEPPSGLWSPRAAAFMDRGDVSTRTGVLRLGPEASDATVSLARYAAFGRSRVVHLARGASEAAGRAAAATGAVVIGPAVRGAPWPTYEGDADAEELIARALHDDARARAWIAASRVRLRQERRAAVADVIASVRAPRSASCARSHA